MFTFCIPVEAHRAKDLEKTLMSLTLQTDQDFKVSVTCDTEPDNEVRAIIEKYKSLDIKYKLVLQKNFQRQNRNESVKQADTDYIWLLDCDIPVLTIEAARTVNGLLNPYTVYTVALFDSRLSPAQFNVSAGNKSAHEVVELLTKNLKDSDFDGLGMFYQLTKKPFQTNHIADNMPIMPKALYEVVGGIHPHYHGWGGEKHEFCLKLKRLARDRAINIFHIPSIRTVHIPHTSIHRKNAKLRAHNHKRFNYIQFGLEHGYLYIQKDIDEMKKKLPPIPIDNKKIGSSVWDQLYAHYKYGIDELCVDGHNIKIDPMNPLKNLLNPASISKDMIYRMMPTRKGKPEILVGITTRNRPQFFQQTIESLLESLDEHYSYRFVIADDNSTCEAENRKIAATIPYPTDYIFAKQRIGIHANNNVIFRKSGEFNYDLGFCMDDDLLFKKGWTDLYYDAYRDTGFPHYCLFDPQTSISIRYSLGSPVIDKINNTKIIAHAPHIVQGAFFTFNKLMIATIGGMDAANFGLTSNGHVDYTIRARRAGFMPDRGFDYFFDVYGGARFVCLNLRDYVPASSKDGKDKSQKFFDKVARDAGRIKVAL